MAELVVERLQAVLPGQELIVGELKRGSAIQTSPATRVFWWL